MPDPFLYSQIMQGDGEESSADKMRRMTEAKLNSTGSNAESNVESDNGSERPVPPRAPKPNNGGIEGRDGGNIWSDEKHFSNATDKAHHESMMEQIAKRREAEEASRRIAEGGAGLRGNKHEERSVRVANAPKNDDSDIIGKGNEPEARTESQGKQVVKQKRPVNMAMPKGLHSDIGFDLNNLPNMGNGLDLDDDQPKKRVVVNISQTDEPDDDISDNESDLSESDTDFDDRFKDDEVYSVNNTNDTESKKTRVKKDGKKRAGRISFSGNSVLKNIPTGLIQLLKDSFEQEASQDKLVTAFLWLQLGEPDWPGMPDWVKPLANSYKGDTGVRDIQDKQEDMDRRMVEMSMALKNINAKLDSVELGVTYSLYRDMGFARKKPNVPGETDFAEAGIRDMMNTMEYAARQEMNKKKIREGRPIK